MPGRSRSTPTCLGTEQGHLMTVLDQFLNYNRNWVAENAHRAPREHEASPNKGFGSVAATGLSTLLHA